MKKSFKSLLILLPITFGLLACQSVPTPDANKAVETPNVVTENTCYLVLTRNGLYNKQPGKNFDELFLENTIAFTGAPKTKLPGKDVVTSKIKNVEFSNWICYENTGKPTIYSEIPEENNKILYAFFSSNDPHGGEVNGGGDITPPTPEPPSKEGLSIKSNKQTVEAEYTGLANNVKGSAQYHAKVTFALDEVWNIEYKNNSKVNKWETGDGSAFSAKQMTCNGKQGKDAGDATVKLAGTYDIYIKIYENGWVDAWVGAIKDTNAPDIGDSETQNTITITATNLPDKYCSKVTIYAWYWGGTIKDGWALGTIDPEAKTVKFEIPESCQGMTLLVMKENIVPNWDQRIGKTKDIILEKGKTTYEPIWM